jgi:MFS family permease
MYLGGAWATRYAANDERLQLKAMAIAIGTAGVLMVFAYLSDNPYYAFALIGPHVVLLAAISPLLNSTIQTLVPQHMRAISVAIVSLVSNLIGMGLGPLAAGALSDGLRPWVGEESLRYALLMLAPGYLWGAWHAWRAGKTVERDLAASQLEHLVSWDKRQAQRVLHATE